MVHILLTGGGTGGHTYPLLAVAEELRKQHGTADTVLRYIGPRSPMMEREREAFAAANIPATFISAGKMRRYAALQNFLDPFVTLWGVLQALYYLVRYMPDVVFAKGGYGAVPVVIAATIYRIPVMIHESDAVPGIANRMLGKLARRIAITYKHAAQYFSARKVALVGVPVREDVLHGDAQRARTRYNMSAQKPIMLVLGGSQGAAALNTAITDALPMLAKHAQIIHQTGTAHHDAVLRAAGRAGFKSGHDGYVAVPFLTAAEMGDALAAADIVLSRAGAGAIAEIAAYAKPAILVPINLSANDHQRINAYEIAKAGGAVVLEEGNLGDTMLTQTVADLLADVALRTAMSHRIASFYHENAAVRIAQGLLEMAHK